MDEFSIGVVSLDKFDIPLKEIEPPRIKYWPSDMSIKDAISEMVANKNGIIILGTESKVEGVLSEKDIVMKLDFYDKKWGELPASSLMTPNPNCLTVDSSVVECIRIFSREGFRNMPLLDENGKPHSLVTIVDLLRHLSGLFVEQLDRIGPLTEWEVHSLDYILTNAGEVQAEEEIFNGDILLHPLSKVLGNNPVIVDANQSVEEVINVLREKKNGPLLITTYETELKGIVTERDLISKVFNVDFNKIRKKPISSIMTANPHTLLGKHLVAHAINNMNKYRYRNIIVVDQDLTPMGSVGMVDIFRYISKLFKSS